MYRCPLRWADLDQLGHVNNVTYVDYLQEARADLMRRLFPERDGAAPGEGLTEGVVVVRHEVTYLAPMPLRFRPVNVEVWVTQVRAASFTLAYEVFHDDDTAPDGRLVYLRAVTVLSPFVFAQERPRRLTDVEKAALETYREPEPAWRQVTPRLAPVPDAGAFHYPVHVRFSDVDAYRHVNNVVYVEYFQEARLRMMREISRSSGEVFPTVVVAQADVDYHRPLLFREQPYDCWSQITALGSRSITIEAEIRDGATVCARSRVVLVVFDAATQRSAAPSDRVREALLGVLAERVG